MYICVHTHIVGVMYVCAYSRSYVCMCVHILGVMYVCVCIF